MVPFLNLKLQYDGIREEIAEALQGVLDTSAFAGGPKVTAFEQDFARFCQSKHAIGMGSGTEALWAVLVALGIGPGDEVITVPNTFIATAEAISFAGAKPVFVDIDERTYNMDPARLEGAIGPNTKAIIPVHLYGQTADMDPILAVAQKYNLHVVEDAAQAHDAYYKGRHAGTMGIAGEFSFYPGKNLGAYGDAGGVVTNDEELAANLLRFRDHGQSRKYHHSLIGWNARMDGMQGAVLQVKLKYLSQWTELRRRNAKLYCEKLADVEEIVLPVEAENNKHVYHVFATRVKNRDDMLKVLNERGIQCGIHYPVPVHLQEAYRDLGLGEGSFPIAERISAELLSLPMFPELTEEQIDEVVREVKNYFANDAFVSVGAAVEA